jgi:hypothetical protein
MKRTGMNETSTFFRGAYRGIQQLDGEEKAKAKAGDGATTRRLFILG